MHLLILTGMSGAGKSSALKILEDIGFLCVDNLPIKLIDSLVESAAIKSDERVAVGIDIRNADAITDLQEILSRLDREEKKYDILFLDASDEVLLKRYKETRRNHPLANGRRLEDGIREEREKIEFLHQKANYIIDTSHLLVRDLKAELEKIFVDKASFKSLNVLVMSFGFKYGIPTDADLVFDVRFLPNPFYIPELRPLTGKDIAIQEYVLKYEDAHTFISKTSDLISFLIPRYIEEGKTSLVIAIGCTGGKHRSVVLSREIYKALEKTNDGSYGISIYHRDIDNDKKQGK